MHTPTSDEVLHALGLSRIPQNAAPPWVAPLAVFTAGVLTGAAVALLVTPRSGREVRHEIGVAAQRVGHDVGAAAQRVGHDVKHVANRLGAKARAALPGGHDVAEEIPDEHAVHAAINEGMPPMGNEVATDHVRGRRRTQET